MSRLQRYVARELVAAFLLLLAIVTAIVGAGLMLQFLHRAPELGLVSIARAVPFVLPEAFPITMPLAFLVACLLAYGRFADDNEFTALRMGGIHPWHAVAPAVLIGAVLSLGTLWLNTEVLPWATLGKRAIQKDQIQRLLRALETSSQTEVPLGKTFHMSAARREPDGAFSDVHISFRADEDQGRSNAVSPGELVRESFEVRADRAWLWIDDVGESLVIRMEQMRWVGQALTMEHDEVTIAIALDRLTSRPPQEQAKDDRYMTAPELLYRMERGSSDGRLARKWAAEYWRRIALGLTPLVFGLLGATLGLFTARGSRASAFVTALVVALPVYYPVARVGENLAVAGHLPAPAGLMLGNVVLTGAGLIFLVRVVRA